MTIDQLRGNIFEILVLRLVLNCGYHLFPELEDENFKVDKNNHIIEYKGRGSCHQIDIPVDANDSPDFIYPIRLLGEVKCYRTHKVSKDIVRERIGVMMDIQQNYFSQNASNMDLLKNRYTECFAIFSASGFDLNAEKLAYAHNIKTISFENDPNINELRKLSYALSSDWAHLDVEIQKNNLKYLYENLILRNGDYNTDFMFKNKNAMAIAMQLSYFRTTFIGTTSSGLTLFFESNIEFDFEKIFKISDEVKCRISYNEGVWVLYPSDFQNQKLYFSMPQIVLDEKIEKSGNKYYPRKMVVFDKIYFKKTIDNIKRSLSFSFDNEWLVNEMNNLF